MASASGLTFLVHRESIHVAEETRQVCSVFRIDPLVSLSEGTLLLTCKKDRVDQVTRRLRRSGIPSFAIGEVVKRRKNGLLLLEESGAKTRQVVSKRDPYWRAYYRAIKSNLS
jgi:hydrogenase maturation factor